MRALDRKLLRDLARMKVQALAIALVVAAGASLFLTMFTAYRSLATSQHRFYTEQRFADVWSSLARAPRSVEREIAAIPGVAAVDARIVAPAIVDVPGLADPASALVVSIPPAAGHAVNDLYLRRGRHVEAGHAGEILISEGFAEANRLSLGSTLAVVIEGRGVTLRIVGVALSPEHVMPISPSGLQDDRRFAIAWMDEDQLEAFVGKRGAFDNVALRLASGADEGAVIRALDRVLAPYGGQGAYGRSSQPSHTMLEEHLLPLRTLAMVIPTIFLLVAAFLVNVVLSRVIATQREQIGMLKAFGYTNARIAPHYLEMVLVVVVVGVILALPVGAWLGRGLARFMAEFFKFPALVYRLDLDVAATAAAIAIGAVTAGAFGALRRVFALPPIVAMSPEVPTFRGGLFDRLGLTPLFSTASRIVLRNLLRRPVRSGLASTGMAFAVAVVVLGGGSGDAMTRSKDVWFQYEQRQDVSIQLAHARAAGTVLDFLSLPGVLRVEPYRVVPARVIVGRSRLDVTLVGLTPNATMRHVVDSFFREIPPPRTGFVMTRWLADHLGLQRGDLVAIEIRENAHRVVAARLVDVVDEPLFKDLYFDLGALGRLLGEPETYTGANLAIDPLRERELFAALKRLPVAASADLRRAALVNYSAMSDPVRGFIQDIEIVFAIIIAFGVVYNTARIALAERGRELATLRVLGFTRGEVSAILLGEVGTLALPAIPLGCLVGRLLVGVVVRAMSGERMHPPVVVSPGTYALAIVVFLIAATASALVVRRGADRLDLLATLKARE